jgi:hypothetical protein
MKRVAYLLAAVISLAIALMAFSGGAFASGGFEGQGCGQFFTIACKLGGFDDR